MTPERRAEIQARLDAATPGPWKAHLSNTPPHYREAPVVSHKANDYGDRLGRFVLWEGDPEQVDKDALLIANAPTDLAALLAYVDQLEGLLRDLCEDSRAAAEVVRLRKVIEEAAEDLSVLSRQVYKDSPADSFLLLRSVSYLSSALTPEGRSLGSLK